MNHNNKDDVNPTDPPKVKGAIGEPVNISVDKNKSGIAMADTIPEFLKVIYSPKSDKEIGENVRKKIDEATKNGLPISSVLDGIFDLKKTNAKEMVEHLYAFTDCAISRNHGGIPDGVIKKICDHSPLSGCILIKFKYINTVARMPVISQSEKNNSLPDVFKEVIGKKDFSLAFVNEIRDCDNKRMIKYVSDPDDYLSFVNKDHLDLLKSTLLEKIDNKPDYIHQKNTLGVNFMSPNDGDFAENINKAAVLKCFRAGRNIHRGLLSTSLNMIADEGVKESKKKDYLCLSVVNSLLSSGRYLSFKNDETSCLLSQDNDQNIWLENFCAKQKELIPEKINTVLGVYLNGKENENEKIQMLKRSFKNETGNHDIDIKDIFNIISSEKMNKRNAAVLSYIGISTIAEVFKVSKEPEYKFQFNEMSRPQKECVETLKSLKKITRKDGFYHELPESFKKALDEDLEIIKNGLCKHILNKNRRDIHKNEKQDIVDAQSFLKDEFPELYKNHHEDLKKRENFVDVIEDRNKALNDSFKTKDVRDFIMKSSKIILENKGIDSLHYPHRDFFNKFLSDKENTKLIPKFIASTSKVLCDAQSNNDQSTYMISSYILEFLVNQNMEVYNKRSGSVAGIMFSSRRER